MQESPIEPPIERQGEPHAGERIDYTVSRGEAIAAMQEATEVMLRSVRWGTAVYVLAVASVVCGIAIGMGYMELLNGYIGRNWRLQWLIVVAFLAVCLLTIWGQRLRDARMYATCVDGSTALGPQVLTLGDDVLTHTGGGITARMPWATFKHVMQSDSKLLIIFKKVFFRDDSGAGVFRRGTT